MRVLQVCLGRDFDGAGLTFCGYMGEGHHRHFTYRHTHVKGHCLVHLGRRRHGADDIRAGHRLNLIMWNYCHGWRASPEFQRRMWQRERARPDAQCTSYTHDRDYEDVNGAERPEPRFAATAWCPPPQVEYEGFAGKDGRYKRAAPPPVDPGQRDLPW